MATPRTRSLDPASQHEFPALLSEAEQANRAHRLARETAHLPATLAEGIGYYRQLLKRHHAAVLAGDEAEAKRQRKDADLLALKLNGGARGYLGDDDAPGCILQRRTAARPGKVPLWGQVGRFIVEAAGMRVRIEARGLYGVCGYASFTAHVVDLDRPFLSETGYRSFLGYGPGATPGLTVDAYAQRVIEAFVKGELRGRLLSLAPQLREREG